MGFELAVLWWYLGFSGIKAKNVSANVCFNYKNLNSSKSSPTVYCSQLWLEFTRSISINWATALFRWDWYRRDKGGELEFEILQSV